MAIEEKGILELAETLSGLSEAQGQVLMAQTSWAMAEALLSSGYRKFEIVDEPSAPVDGGPAFGELKQIGDRAIKQGGLTIRDYFAAKALQGLISNESAVERFKNAEVAEGFESVSLMANASYQVADAMLKERAQ